MKDMGADVIFAVDVGSVNDSTPQRYGDSLSGKSLLNETKGRSLGNVQSL
jgi:hypothetical protein